MVAFIITLALTLYMTGMIWSMQILEYPLFALVGQKEFPAYHRRHNRGLPVLVILPSLGAFMSALVLIFTRPARLALWVCIVVVVIDVVVILATVVREAPLPRATRPGRPFPASYSPTRAGQLGPYSALDRQCDHPAGGDGPVRGSSGLAVGHLTEPFALWTQA